MTWLEWCGVAFLMQWFFIFVVLVLPLGYLLATTPSEDRE